MDDMSFSRFIQEFGGHRERLYRRMLTDGFNGFPYITAHPRVANASRVIATKFFCSLLGNRHGDKYISFVYNSKDETGVLAA